MSEVISFFWRGIQDEDMLNVCQECCNSAEFYLMADCRIVCANCETLITNLKTEEIQ